MIQVRISPTIANEYATRQPDYLPEKIHTSGLITLTLAEATTLLEDAEFNSDLTAFDVGQDAMPLGAFNAYRALARQLQRTLPR